MWIDVGNIRVGIGGDDLYWLEFKGKLVRVD